MAQVSDKVKCDICKSICDADDLDKDGWCWECQESYCVSCESEIPNEDDQYRVPKKDGLYCEDCYKQEMGIEDEDEDEDEDNCMNCDSHNPALYPSGGDDKICKDCYVHLCRPQDPKESLEDYIGRHPHDGDNNKRVMITGKEIKDLFTPEFIEKCCQNQELGEMALKFLIGIEAQSKKD